MSIASIVVRICRDVCEDPSVSLESTTRMVEKWDSLAHMRLIASIEERFGIELDIMDMAEVDSVRDVVAVVERTRRPPGGVIDTNPAPSTGGD